MDRRRRITDEMLAGSVSDPFDDLFATEYRRVVAIARRFVGADAEDVAQDVFAAFARLRSPDAARARAWLHRATANRAIVALRSRGRRDARERRSVRLDGAPQSVAEPAQRLETLERAEAVRAALARLPQRSATVLALRAAELSYKEIAAVLGTTPNAVGALLVRAEALLRKELSHDPSFA